MIDSDFSIDENDEPVSDPDDEEGKKRKRKPLATKAYREPTAKKPTISKASTSKQAESQSSSAAAASAPKSAKKPPASTAAPAPVERSTYTVMDSGKRHSLKCVLASVT